MSETARLLPPGIDFGATDEPIKATGWKNLYFAKDGMSFLGSFIYPTEADASEAEQKSPSDVQYFDPQGSR